MGDKPTLKTPPCELKKKNKILGKNRIIINILNLVFLGIKHMDWMGGQIFYLKTPLLYSLLNSPKNKKKKKFSMVVNKFSF
ncbi:hypothetical protein DDB_G0270804 [Dictyostelium discoideum AX4]|uniref:Uncharacterized protein n=1 Tax=Dictyostelium discoideum TaxID=44689 RepID=Q55BR1_DICDI|nr:hypothetical protein DDB_G0270804 [Dictyostelium discoideum AX4]EAL72752.1 hypothetical protein DDB_G0270804 [Dictyostelium discoideum AX4]|eukprot:XP_646770.1 hypothetical protein DDB_G0270804 [Dictyostelium discoideum AX4]